MYAAAQQHCQQKKSFNYKKIIVYCKNFRKHLFFTTYVFMFKNVLLVYEIRCRNCFDDKKKV